MFRRLGPNDSRILSPLSLAPAVPQRHCPGTSLEPLRLLKLGLSNMRAMQPLLEQVLAEMESQVDTSIDGVERGEPLSLRSTFSSGSCAGTFGTFGAVGQYGGCLGS